MTDDQLAAVIAKRGYLVIWSTLEHSPGHILSRGAIDDYDGPQPFVVIERTDGKDHVEQMQMLGYNNEPSFGLTPDVRFYRVTTD